MSTKKYKVTGGNQLKHNGKRYYDGDAVEMKVEAGDELVAQGVLINTRNRGKADDGEANPADGAEVSQGEIIDAINMLDANDPDHFSDSTGKPHVKAIEAVLGKDITSEQRDEAWESIEA